MTEAAKERVRVGLFVAVAVVLAAHFLEVAAYRFGDNFSMDALLHHWQVLRAPTFAALRLNLKHEFQPILDYALRKYLWYPILGENERAMRLPGAVAALALLAFSTSALFLWARRQASAVFSAAVLALGYAFWITGQPVIVNLLSESKHYELTAFVSVLWWHAHFLRGKRDTLYALSCLALVNTHFFAVPFLATAIAWDAILAWRAGRKRQAGLLVASAVAGLGATVWLNWPALSYLLTCPWPAHEPVSFADSVALAWNLYTRWFTLFRLPLGWLLPLLALASLRGRPERAAVAIQLLVTLPLFALAVRLRSRYSFQTRYYMPFFGLTYVLYAWGAERLLDGCGRAVRWARAHVPRVPRGIAWEAAALAGLAVLPPSVRFFRSTWTGWNQVALPPENFTPFYRDYRKVQQLKGPFLLLVQSFDSHQDVIAQIYLRHLIPHAKLIGLFSPWNRGPDRAANFASLVRSKPGVWVVFETRRERGSCPLPPSERLAGHDVLDLKGGSSCLLAVRGIKTLEEARAVAEASGLSMRWL